MSVAWTNRVAKLEFNLTSMPTPFTGRENSAYIAGLAYYAHTQDMRPDVTTDPLTKGMQTASTYWVDVRETQNTEPRRGNQYWLAAKYGGFTLPDPDGNSVFTTVRLRLDHAHHARCRRAGGMAATPSPRTASRVTPTRPSRVQLTTSWPTRPARCTAPYRAPSPRSPSTSSGAGSSLASNSTQARQHHEGLPGPVQQRYLDGPAERDRPG